MWAIGEPEGGNAGVFEGDVDLHGTVTVVGTLDTRGPITKSGGGFLIDHPLDPGKKFLAHSFVESDERKNIYDGLATLNRKGEAVIMLPKWFESLNAEYRYQLTAIGSAAPNLHVSRKMKAGSFEIAGGSAGQEISWHVTGVRQDPWAQKNLMIVEEPKKQSERGFYRHPEVYGKSEKLRLQPGASSKKASTARTKKVE